VLALHHHLLEAARCGTGGDVGIRLVDAHRDLDRTRVVAADAVGVALFAVGAEHAATVLLHPLARIRDSGHVVLDVAVGFGFTLAGYEARECLGGDTHQGDGEHDDNHLPRDGREPARRIHETASFGSTQSRPVADPRSWRQYDVAES